MNLPLALHAVLPLLVDSDVAAPYRYSRPFLQPLPVWNDSAWPWLLLPLCLGVAIVYKCIKCRSMKTVPREAVVLTFWILLGMGTAALGLALVVRFLERT